MRFLDCPNPPSLTTNVIVLEPHTSHCFENDLRGRAAEKVGLAALEPKALYAIITTTVSSGAAACVTMSSLHQLLGPRVSRQWLPAGTWGMFRLIDPMLENNQCLQVQQSNA